MEEPTKELVPTEVSTEEVAPTEDPTEELIALMATFSELVEKPDVPPLQCKEREKGEVPCSNFPSWTAS